MATGLVGYVAGYLRTERPAGLTFAAAKELAAHPSRGKWEVDALNQSIKVLEQLTRYRHRLLTERRAGSQKQ